MLRFSIRPLAREIAESNRRVAECVEAGWRAARALHGDTWRREAKRNARELTRFTLSRRHDPRAVWEGALEIFAEGLAGQESKELLQLIRNLIDTWLLLAEKTRAWWREVGDATGDMPEGLEELDAAEREVNEVKAAAEKMYGFVGRSRPPIDPTRLQRGEQQIREGKSKTCEEMRSLFNAPKHSR